MNVERLLKLKQEAETMVYLKKHNADIQKVYADVRFNQIIEDINAQLFAYNMPFRKMTDEEYMIASKVFS